MKIENIRTKTVGRIAGWREGAEPPFLFYDDSTNLAEVLSSDQIRIEPSGPGRGNSYGNQNVGGYSSMDKGKSPKGQESQPTFDNKGNGNAYGKNKENNGNAYGKYKEKETGQEKNADKGNKNNENSNKNQTKVNENSNKPEDSGKDADKERGKSGEKSNKSEAQTDKDECQGNSGKNGCEKVTGRDREKNGNANGHSRENKGPQNANGNAYAYGYYKKLYGSSYYDSSNSSSPSSYSNLHGPTGGKAQGRGGGVFKGEERQHFFYHGDHLGSNSLTTDKLGEVHDRTLYFPFGEVWLEEGGNEDKDLLGFKFAGKELDDETGYFNFGARYYDPVIAGWLSTDPAFAQYMPTASQLFFPEVLLDPENVLKGGGGIYHTVNLNVYHYAGQNPIKYVDPNGKWLDTALDLVSVAYSAYEYYNDPSEENLIALSLDAAAVIVPGVTGAGKAYKAYKATERANDARKTLDKANDVKKAAKANPCSFTAETLVITPDGPKAIAELKDGDYVLSKNEYTGEQDWRKVNGVLVKEHEEIIQLDVINSKGEKETIYTTEEHPFFVLDHGWTDAGYLNENERILAVSNTVVTIEKIVVIAEATDAYSLDVDGYETYFVGETGIWVHNCSINNRLDKSKGRVHEKTGVKFNEQGFPDFSGHLYKGGKNDVKINPTGNRAKDAKAANEAAGYEKTPDGYVWHHHEDTGRMQLVDEDIHQATGHVGGFSTWDN